MGRQNPVSKIKSDKVFNCQIFVFWSDSDPTIFLNVDPDLVAEEKINADTDPDKQSCFFIGKLQTLIST